MSHYETLQRKFCPPLEEALFIAIASDYDLQNDVERLRLEGVLQGLRDGAMVEQEMELVVPIDPSNLHVDQNTGQAQLVSGLQTIDIADAEGNVESITTGLSELTTSAQESSVTDQQDLDDLPEGLQNASSVDKEAWLKLLFPTIEAVQVHDTVVRCNGDIQRSVDELLNLSFIGDDIDQSYTPPQILKGVEGFAAKGKTRRVKGKRNRRWQDKDDLNLSDRTVSSGAVTPINVWQSANEDVDFIVSRTQMSTQAVKSVYHQNSANRAQTIKTLLIKEFDSQASKIASDPILLIQMEELKLECQYVQDKYLYGALLLAQWPSAAKDLIDAMRTPLLTQERPTKLLPQYIPIKLSDDEDPRRKALRSETPPSDPALLIGKAGTYSLRADRAFSQASSAFRRGKSDHLMRGAAASYASIGHEQRQHQKDLLSSATDALVAQQSSANTLDLHGATVEHAVRISQARVEQWWDALGDQKYVINGIRGGYKIIVGLGTHSHKGIGRIGPAVSKMLIREGWKVNIQRGEIYVEGRKR